MSTRRAKQASGGGSFDLAGAVAERTAFVGARIVDVRKDELGISQVVNGEGSALSDVSDGIVPPYDPDVLCHVLEHSNSLRQCVDAYATNIDGFGYHLEPVIDLDADDAQDKVRDAIYLEHAATSEVIGSHVTLPVTDADVAARIALWRTEMRVEKFKIESFFDHCSTEESFVSLRRKTRHDIEVTGNGFWEVIRGVTGKIQQFVYMPSQSVRLLPRHKHEVKVKMRVRTGPIEYADHDVPKRFRRYVQKGDFAKVYFKEFGDPRCVSSKTGKTYPTEVELREEEPRAVPAHECIHFRIHSSRTAYGIPRWIGNLISVLGSRQSEEVNFLYFENKSIPPLAILVSGGRMTSGSVKKIEDYLRNEIKGKRNFHKVLILEAESGGGASSMLDDPSGKTKIEIKPLTDAHMKDGLFQQYDANNIDKVGMSFRLPRLLRGDIRDFNRASAQAALEFAECQVFAPERDDFDFLVNRIFLSAMRARFWRFKSNAVPVRDPESVSKMIAELTIAGVLVPADGRKLASESVFGKDLPKIDEAWTRQPLVLTAAGLSAGDPSDVGVEEHAAPDSGGASTQTIATQAKKARSRILLRAQQVLKDRAALEVAEKAEVAKEFAADKMRAKKAASGDESPEVVRFTKAEMLEKFGIEVAA